MAKSILITGAGSGFGLLTAVELGKKGHHVIATTESESQFPALQQAAAEQGLNFTIEKLNITNEKDCTRAGTWEIDVLINNAGCAESGPLAEIPQQYLRRNFDVNVFGTIDLTQKVVKSMLERKQHGYIMIMGSVAGRVTAPYIGPYCMTKYALEAAAEVLNAELASHNIDISIIEPGPYGTEFNKRMNESKYKWYGDDSIFAGDKEVIQGLEEFLLAGHYDPIEVAHHMADMIESDEKPEFRVTLPAEWAEKVRKVVHGEIASIGEA